MLVGMGLSFSLFCEGGTLWGGVSRRKWETLCARATLRIIYPPTCALRFLRVKVVVSKNRRGANKERKWIFAPFICTLC